MAPLTQNVTSGISMQDEFGITYVVENAQQFWSELEDMLHLGKEPPTLSLLDSTLRRFLTMCATYHEQYLQSPLQVEHACGMLLDSELFQFHSERMCEILTDDIQSTTDPHSRLIFFHVLLCYGRRRTDFFRSHKRWQPLLPLLMDHILVEIDPDVEDTYFGVIGGSNGNYANIPIPIEAKLRSLSVRLLYEVCRVQKFSAQDLKVFDANFIDYLYDLVEQTRNMQDETFNYSVVKLIVALNEQFMVAALGSEQEGPKLTHAADAIDTKNRIIRVLMRRLGSSKTFGENMIFMLNRAERTPDDLCMQLLILKLLYVLFTTKGTSEYFYTNDLRVLVDVFLRELVDLDEESESLRQTYLRVLHPLLTKTQLRDVPYKRPQIVYALESLVANARVRDINPTTKRLVDRCLGGEWCVNLVKRQQTGESTRSGSPGSDAPNVQSPTPLNHIPASAQLSRKDSKKLKSSKSVENMKARNLAQKVPHSPLDNLRRPSNASSISLAAATAPSSPITARPKRAGTAQSVHADGHESHLHTTPVHRESEYDQRTHHLISPVQVLVAEPQPITRSSTPPRRAAPPPPVKRRPPPAIPDRTLGGATITPIKKSSSATPPPRPPRAHTLQASANS